MNIKQQQAAFEAWYQHHHGDRDAYVLDASGEYADKQVQGAFNVWQAALQSPEVQALRKDAERLDFMISEECQIQSLSTPNEVRHRLSWPDYGEAQSEWFINPRAALDAAMEKQK